MASKPQNSAQPKRRLAKKREIGLILACSVDTIDRYIKAGKLPVVTLPSGQQRIDLDELDRLIDDDWRSL